MNKELKVTMHVGNDEAFRVARVVGLGGDRVVAFGHDCEGLIDTPELFKDFLVFGVLCGNWLTLNATEHSPFDPDLEIVWEHTFYAGHD